MCLVPCPASTLHCIHVISFEPWIVWHGIIVIRKLGFLILYSDNTSWATCMQSSGPDKYSCLPASTARLRPRSDGFTPVSAKMRSAAALVKFRTLPGTTKGPLRPSISEMRRGGSSRATLEPAVGLVQFSLKVGRALRQGAKFNRWFWFFGVNLGGEGKDSLALYIYLYIYIYIYIYISKLVV